MARGVLVALVLAVAAAACTTSGDGATTSTAGPTTTAPATTTTGEPEATSPPAVATDPSGLALTDTTAAAGVSFFHATPYSEEDYTPAMSVAKMISGAGVGDFDRDGDQDLFVVGGGISHDALYRNEGDGTFTDVAESAGIRGDLHLGSGVAVGDYDGDGWLDIFISSHGTPLAPEPGRHRLWRNNGDMTFSEMAAEAGVATTATDQADGFGSVFADYDLDGDLDLFVAGWQKESAGDRLFANDGDGTFTDVTDEAGIVDDGIRGFSPCLVDTNLDRYPDLMLVADFGTSRYFANNGDGTFAERTEETGAGREWSGMGTAVADWNNDGLFDWYATAIFDITAAGRGDGNKLYYNMGNHQWEETAAAAGVDDGGWGWGAVGVDLDHDGWQDIVEVNGWHFEGYEAYTDTPARVWLANGDGTFREAAAGVGLDYRQMGLGILTFDYDGDGDQDLAMTSPNDAFRLFRNDLEADRHWLHVTLDTSGTDLPPDGIGARVVATTATGSYYRHVGGCSNYLTTPELSAHFGLGDAAMVDELRIEWPDGTTTVVEGVQADRFITVTP